MNTDLLNELASKTIMNHSPELQETNRNYLKKLMDNGFTLDPEAYRFSNISSALDNLELNQSKKALTPQTPDENSHTILIKDGVISGDLPAINGVTFYSNTTSLELPEDFTGTGLLHKSFLGGILVIEIKKNHEIEKPIRILRESNKAEIDSFTLVLKSMRNSKAILIEENVGKVSSFVNSSETFIFLEDGAHLEHIQMDFGQEKSLTHSKTMTKIAQDANYKNIVFHLNGKMNRRNTSIEMNAPGANGESYNLFLTSNSEHSDINTQLIHSAADTTSNQIAKGILADESKGIFTGKIHIRKYAQRVASGQLNKNLLLSKKAQVHSMPQLEIFADDVKCSHGSTTGQLSDEELFYFQARGIPANKARTLLAYGFALEIVKKITDALTRKRIELIVLHLLQTKFHIGDENE